MSEMARILVVAENYAFGPIGKLLTITKHLKQSGHTLIFIGDGTAYQLGKKEDFDEIHQINTDSNTFREQVIYIFNDVDCVLSSMDRSSVLLAQELHISVICIDILFWWWYKIPEYLYNVDLYIKQNSIIDSRNKDKYWSKFRNIVEVGPIIDLSILKDVEPKNQVIVAYGGMEAEGIYKVGSDTFYPYTMTELLVKTVDFGRFDTVIFTGNEKIIDDLKSKYETSKFKFMMFNHERFIRELASSAIAIMVPGLETPLEAFSYNVPTIFLPPSNSSQYVQLDEFRKYHVAYASIHFRDYLKRSYFAGRNLHKIMQEFLVQLNHFENTEWILDDVSKRINEYLSNKKKLAKQVEQQKRFISSLGSDGLENALKIINQFIEEIT